MFNPERLRLLMAAGKVSNTPADFCATALESTPTRIALAFFGSLQLLLFWKGEA